MKRRTDFLGRTFWFGLLTTIAIARFSQAQAQMSVGPTVESIQPSSGTYRITGGVYIQCCGIAGPIGVRLPYSGQAYLRLTVEQRGLANMTILAADMKTVARPALISGFSFSFTNGMVMTDPSGGYDPPGHYIWFGDPLTPPWPLWLPSSDWPSEGYLVFSQGNTLRINGAVTVPCNGCSDIPREFTHSNVTAVLAGPIIDQIQTTSNSLRFHFAGEPPYQYTVEFKDSLDSITWQTLTTHVALAMTIDVAVTNSFTNTATRFFRVRKQRVMTGE